MIYAYNSEKRKESLREHVEAGLRAIRRFYRGYNRVVEERLGVEGF